jgi:hypothetical protein
MITGQVTNDELLGNIFANFCIGNKNPDKTLQTLYFTGCN